MSNKIDKNDLKCERGQRVRFVRKSLMNMTTEKFACYCGVARSTITNWECGFKNGLTELGAEKIVNTLQMHGWICTTVWLFYNIGPTPETAHAIKTNTALDSTKTHYLLEKSFVSYGDFDASTACCEEILLFKKRHKNYLVYQIVDNTLSPFYKVFDNVGGIKLSQEQFKLAQNVLCIVLLHSQRYLIGKIIMDNCHPIQKISIVHPVDSDIFLLTAAPLSEVQAIAPIIRMWRKQI